MIERIKFYFRVIIYNTFLVNIKKEAKLFQKEYKQKGKDSVPIFIINYNRLSYIEKFVSQLEMYGFTNINIIDNCSTYPPLLEYYKKIPYHL